jgi:formate hydrogenlyase subunit 6/NADH:ubiquinone oxidoreductase subunit I
MSVFATEGKDEKLKTIVKNPNSCVVTCTGCDDICPAGAISHPSKKEFTEKIRILRIKPEYKLEKKSPSQ